MRKLVVGEFVSVDGVAQAPGAQDEDQDGGFAHGGWVGSLVSEDLYAYLIEMITSADAYLFGRKTFEISSGAWPNIDDSNPIAEAFNNRPKYVVSNTLTETEWKHSTIISGDVVQAITDLKAQEGGDIQVAGSPTLIQTLLENNLVDEIILVIFPVVIGSGKRLFGGGTLPKSLKLVSTKSFDSGAIVTIYRREGDLVTSSHESE